MILSENFSTDILSNLLNAFIYYYFGLFLYSCITIVQDLTIAQKTVWYHLNKTVYEKCMNNILKTSITLLHALLPLLLLVVS